MDTDNDSTLQVDSDSKLKIVTGPSNWIQITSRFEKMELKSGLLEILLREYDQPLPLQCKALSPCCLGRDTLIAAPTNSGKTTSAIISVLNNVNFTQNQCQAVFFVPRTNTASQIKNVISNFLGEKNLERHVCVVDDENIDQKFFTRGVQIIIGTPKSLLKLFSAETYGKEYSVQIVVLEEAEFLLSPDNFESLNILVEIYLQWYAQLILLCTSVSKEILKFIGENMADPVRIIVNTNEELALLEEEAKLQNKNFKCTDLFKNTVSVPMEVDCITPAIVIPATEPTKHEDEFDLLAKLMIIKLRNLPQTELTKMKKFLNLVLFDSLPKYCLIDELIANSSPDSKRSQSTQTIENDFCDGSYDEFDKGLIDADLSNQFESSNVTTCTIVKWIRRFEDAPLKRQIKNGLLYDYKVPLLLQQKSLKLLLNGYDMLIQSPEGSGKTTAIIIHALNLINTDEDEVQTVIVVPTLDLVQKTRESVNAVSQFVENFKCRSVCNWTELRQHVNNGAHMLIIISELLTSINLNTSYLKLFAVEEVDKMISESFDKLIDEFVNPLPAKCQIVLSGSQYNSKSVLLIKRHLLKINITRENLLLHGVHQFSLRSRNEDRKYNYLNELMKKLKNTSISLIFCNTPHEVTTLKARLFEDGVISAVSLIEKLDEQKFNEFFKKFVLNEKKFIITWDYCAQCIDIESVSIVMNYVIPFKRENFIERIRRCGKYKNKSVVINFVTAEEMRLMTDIQNEYGFMSKEVFNYADIELENHTE